MSDAPEPPRVVGAVLLEDAARLDTALSSLRRQSTTVILEVAVGGGTAGRKAAERAEVVWAPTIDGIEIPEDTSHLWFIRDDVEARPDALSSLLVDGDAVDATVAGSKVLAGDDRERLISIGGATDVLCVPVPLLEAGELDQGQYDVIRDVAYIPSQSVLIRRDAFRGLGGIDRLLPPDAAGIDFSQRARVAGGRVVVVPSSEVFSAGAFAAGLPPWREQAGQLRALAKGYSWVSLVWALPLWLLVAAVISIGGALTGRPAALLDLPRSLAWNAKHLGSLLRARRRVAASRQRGDEELFRFQTAGSAALGTLWADLMALARRPLESGQEAVARVERSGFGEGALVTFVGVAVWAASVRGMLGSGLPDGAWTGPLGLPRDVLAAWAGGWNPAGMGGDGPPHPAAALLSLLTWVPGPESIGWVMALSLGVGMLGTYRLARTLRLERWAALLGAAVATLGPMTAAGGVEAGYPLVLGLAAAPGVAHLVAAPLPDGWRPRLGRLARLALATIVLAMAIPVAIGLPLAVAVLVVATTGRSSGLPLAVAGTAMALPLLGPWLLWYDPMALLGPAATPWVPAAWLAAAALVAWVPMVVAGARWQASAIGGVALGAGALLTRGVVSGREAWLAGLVAVALGLGLVAAGTLDRLSRPGRLRILAVPAIAGALVLAIPVAASVVSGRAGIDRPDAAAAVVGYLAARGDGTQQRAVLSGVAHPGSPSGSGGRVDRVVVPSEWGFETAWVGPPGSADRALDATLEAIVDAPVARPGTALAAHGVRWLVTPGGSALDAALSGRLDVVRLVIPEGVIYESTTRATVATSSRGAPWRIGAVDARGPDALTVGAAINPTVRYDAMSVDGGTVSFPGLSGVAVVTPDALLRLVARAGLVWGGGLVVLAVWGRRRT